MNHAYLLLAPYYNKLWDELIPSPEHMTELNNICMRIRSNGATYEQASMAVWGTKDYWWYIAITDQMEGGGGANTYLGNGQSLNEVTTQEPKGRGPFPTFVAGAVDALQGVPAPTSISQAAYNWENFNGWGYLSKPIEDPYLASFSNMYTKGKFTADHVYDPEAVSQQPGALTILKVLMPAYSPHGPVVPSASEPPQSTTAPPIVTRTKGHVMVDVTQVETEVNYALTIAEQVIPWASTLIPGFAPIGAMLLQGIKAVRTIEQQMGIPTSAAIVAAQSHVTPGAPNAPALNG